ncbi:hypothetical protein C8T65DRAFT_699611 [Cerioporus squamosus]|nr:hypothetical protein C8T65DRAFT_699611 [Cerioporus squamosus]
MSRNAAYRRSVLRKLRGAAVAIQSSAETPLSEELQMVVHTAQELSAKLDEVSALKHDQPVVQAELSQLANKLRLTDARAHTLQRRSRGFRRELSMFFTQHSFDDVVKPLREPLPSRTQKRPLSQLVEQLRALRQTRGRIRYRAERLCDDHTESTSRALRRLYDQAHRLQWRQNDLVAEIEGMFLVAESRPATLSVQGSDIDVANLLKAARWYSSAQVQLQDLKESCSSIRSRLTAMTEDVSGLD